MNCSASPRERLREDTPERCDRAARCRSSGRPRTLAAFYSKPRPNFRRELHMVTHVMSIGVALFNVSRWRPCYPAYRNTEHKSGDELERIRLARDGDTGRHERAGGRPIRFVDASHSGYGPSTDKTTKHKRTMGLEANAFAAARPCTLPCLA
ncbi:hypothetical protein EVAR_63769_1 [Eumeta japonica]|uniref:Uncharacterized protein n=1 Tax=Eumeta variegata TaxID=151549 RepID=A0A4C1ZRC9_EUMVA|nr:hypothetical protein EVAR_63769_1 [Eumeta japonica]